MASKLLTEFATLVKRRRPPAGARAPADRPRARGAAAGGPRPEQPGHRQASCTSARTRSRTTSATSSRSCSCTRGWRRSCTPSARSCSRSPDGRPPGAVGAAGRIARAVVERLSLAAGPPASRWPRRASPTRVPPACRTGATLRRVVGRTGLFQIDSVNVLARAHYLPLFSRLGPYPSACSTAPPTSAPRELFEYWGHEASLLPVERTRCCAGGWTRPQHRCVGRHARGSPTEQPQLVADVLAEVRACRAAVGRRDRGVAQRRARRGAPGRGGTGRTSSARIEYLFWAGEVTTARRARGFERLYDLPERVLPAAVLAAPTPDRGRRAARAAAPRGPLARRRGRLATCATTTGCSAADAQARHRRAGRGRRAGAGRRSRAGAGRRTSTPGAHGCRAGSTRGALLSPFDPLVWERDRTERLFGFRYRIEIYVPGAAARARLLRPAVPARRPARRAGRPEGRPGDIGGCWCRPRTPSRTHRPRPARSWSPSCVDGGLARAGVGGHHRSRRPAAAPAAGRRLRRPRARTGSRHPARSRGASAGPGPAPSLCRSWDMYTPQVVGLRAVRRAPDLLEQLALRDQLARVPDEDVQDVPLRRRQPDVRRRRW